MKNITLSADEGLLEAARAQARSQKTTLNEAFRKWLYEYSGMGSREEEAFRVIDQLRGHVVVGRKLTRDEMNAR
jgi:hypothetical protein